MIKITKQNQQKQIQKLLFDKSYEWLNSKKEYMYYNFIDNLYYIVDEKNKKITYISDISDESYHTWNYINDIVPIDAKTILRILKLNRILEKINLLNHTN